MYEFWTCKIKKATGINNFDILQRFYQTKTVLLCVLLVRSIGAKVLPVLFVKISLKTANYVVCSTFTIIPDALTKSLISKLFYCYQV